MHRFFVAPSGFASGTVTFDDEQSHQIARVLRLARGDLVVALDGSGWEYDVRLTQVAPHVTTGAICGKRLSTAEPQVKITLYQALLKGPKNDYALQKATEIGAAAIVPVVSQRCIVGQEGDQKANRAIRWRRIVQEAAEQSGRAKVPVVGEPLPFSRACEQIRGLAVIAWEEERARSLRTWLRETPRPFSAALLVGPEGGFTEDEVALATGRGIVTVSLGPRILRAETAGLVALTQMLHEWGELEPAR